MDKSASGFLQKEWSHARVRGRRAFLPGLRASRSALAFGTRTIARAIGSPIGSAGSWINPCQGTRKRNRLAHVLEPADPTYRALDTHSKAGVRHSAELPQVEIPLEGFFRQVVFADLLQERFVISHALRSADDLTVTFGREHVHAQHGLWILRIGLHVKRLHHRRITMHHHRTVKLLRYVG